MTQEIAPDVITSLLKTGKPYTMFFYKAGPKFAQTEDPQLQMRHLQYLFTLRAEGMLLINGPVFQNEVLKGVGVFATSDHAQVREYLDADPAVQAQRLVYELHSWFSIPGDSLR
jgi:uncharacterized protein